MHVASVKMLNEHPPTFDQIYISYRLYINYFFETATEFAIFGLPHLAKTLAGSTKAKHIQPPRVPIDPKTFDFCFCICFLFVGACKGFVTILLDFF